MINGDNVYYRRYDLGSISLDSKYRLEFHHKKTFFDIEVLWKIQQLIIVKVKQLLVKKLESELTIISTTWNDVMYI